MRPKTIDDLLFTELDDLIEMRKNALAAGAVADFAEYRHLVGVITGLTTAKNIYLSLLKKQREYDE